MQEKDRTTHSVSAPTHGMRLYKKEKLCSVIAINQLFGSEKNKTSGAPPSDIQSTLAYPLRMVWRENPHRSSDATVQFLISVPKKRLRHAVDRVLMRRRIREAYRLSRHQYHIDYTHRYDVAFIYVGSAPENYRRVEKAMLKLLKSLSR